MITDSATVRRMSDELVDLHIAHLQAGGKSPHTISARRSVLRMLHRRLPYGLMFAAEEQIEAWIAELRADGKSEHTLEIYGRHALAFYRWATERGFLDGDPTARVDVPSAPECLPNPVTEEEFMRMLRQLPKPLDTAAVLAGFEGMRVSEIAACRREHITADLVIIPRGKGGRPGTVPTHPFVWDWVQSRPNGPLILNRRGEPVNGHWISMTARYHLDKLHMDDVHMHRLRHRFGTLIQAEGGDVRVTQECLRHRSIQSTMGYTLVTNSRRTAAVASLPVPGTPASH